MRCEFRETCVRKNREPHLITQGFAGDRSQKKQPVNVEALSGRSNS
jgi:hypothetical protein